MTRWSGFLLPTGNMFTFTCILEKNTMSNKNLPPVNVPKDELKAIIAYDKERFSKNLTPLRAVRLKCLDCCGDSSKEVEACSAVSCPLWWYRKSPSSLDATADRKQSKYPTAAQAIKAMCKECCGEDLKGCAMDEYSWCPLLQYKKQKAAKRPVLSEAERARRSERMKAVLARKAS